MRALVAFASLAILAGPSMASAGDLYAAIRGGPGFTADTQRQTLFGGESLLDFKTGFTGGAAVGYAFPFGLRTEGEFGYLHAPLKRDGEVEVGGSIESYLFMVNAYYDLKIPALGPFRPYVGVGLGGARVHNDHEVPFVCPVCLVPFGSNTALDEWRTAFAYQARAGMIYDVNRWLDLSLGYRYVHVNSGRVGQAPFHTDLGALNNHSVELGFAIKF